ncbi:hypothetical protein [Caminibacter pacificus]
MFEKKGDFFTNKDENFLNESDLVIFYNETPKHVLKDYVVLGGRDEFSKVDIPKTSKQLPLLLGRLAYVFDIYDEELKEDMGFEDFVEIALKSLRVKKEIQNHDTTLEEVAGVLYLIDSAKKISLFLGDAEEEEIENLMSFLAMLKNKEIGVFSKNDISEFEITFYER